MRNRRWQHLDRTPTLPPSAGSTSTGGLTPESTPPGGFSETPDLRAARNLFRLGQYAACVALLEGRYDPDLPSVAKLLGEALCRLGDPNGIAYLERASAHTPHDVELTTLLLSAGLHFDLAPALPTDPAGPAAELSAAAYWRQGQQQLSGSQPALAARAFEMAASLFATHSPEAALGERLGLCYLGAAICRLLAGDFDGAQTSFVRLPRREAAPERYQHFAVGIYQLAMEAASGSEDEREEALAPLRELVTQLRLRVGLYEPGTPVDIRWNGSRLWPLSGG